MRSLQDALRSAPASEQYGMSSDLLNPVTDQSAGATGDLASLAA